MLVFPCLLPLQSLPLQMICIPCTGGQQCLFSHAFYPCSHCPSRWFAYPVQVVSSACFPMPSTPAVTAPPDDLHTLYRWSAMLVFPCLLPLQSLPLQMICIPCTGGQQCLFSHAFYPCSHCPSRWFASCVQVTNDVVPLYTSAPEVHCAYCVQVIDDSHFPIPINPCGPCSRWYASCILCAGHRWFLFLYTHQPLRSMFLQAICIMHTVCRSSTIFVPLYPSAPVVHVPPSDMDHAYCVQVIDDSHSSIPCDPCSSKWYGSCILCAGHRRFSFPHTHQPLRSMSSRLLKSGGVAGGTSSSSLEKAILKKKRKKKKKKKKKKKVRSYPSRNAIQSPTIPEEDEEDEEDVSFTGQYLLLLSISFRWCSLKMSLLIVQQTCFHSACFLQSFCVNFWCNTSCSRSRKMFG